MTDQDLDNILRKHCYPFKIDITDAVMRQVSNKPILAPSSKPSPQRIRTRIAAAIATCLVASAFAAQYNYQEHEADEKVAYLLTNVYDYHDNYANSSSVFIEESDIANFLSY